MEGLWGKNLRLEKKVEGVRERERRLRNICVGEENPESVLLEVGSVWSTQHTLRLMGEAGFFG